MLTLDLYTILNKSTQLKSTQLESIDEATPCKITLVLSSFKSILTPLTLSIEISEIISRLAEGILPDHTIRSIVQENDFLHFTTSIPEELRFLERPSLILNAIYEDSFRIKKEVKKATQSLKGPSLRNREGVFYTPLNIVDKILNHTLFLFLKQNANSIPSDLSVLDPACGGGIFLSQSFTRLISEFKSQKSAHILMNCLCGVDKDPLAVFVTRASLFLDGILAGIPESILIPILQNNIKCGNSLINTVPMFDTLSQIKPFNWQVEFSEIIKSGGFKIIIGNPPYGISRDQRISKEELTLLKSNYSNIISGKPDKYLLFMTLALSISAQHALVGMIVPNSWLGIKSGEKFREKIIHNNILKSIDLFDKKVFADPSLEAVIVTLEKGGSSSSFSVNRYVDGNSATSYKSYDIPYSTCLKNKTFLIPTKWSTEIDKCITEIFTKSFLLSSSQSVFEPRIALQAYALGKGTPAQSKSDVSNRVFDSRTKNSHNTYKYLQGSCIERFNIKWGGEYLRHGKFLADPQPIKRFSGPRVLVREIIGELPNLLLATYTDQIFLYNKSVLHIIFKQNLELEIAQQEDLMMALCGIVNSRLGSFIIKFTGRKSQRRIFPKIVNEDLKNFPIPITLYKKVDILAPIVKKLLNTDLSCQSSEAELNKEVFSLYNLSSHTEEVICNMTSHQDFDINTLNV